MATPSTPSSLKERYLISLTPVGAGSSSSGGHLGVSPSATAPGGACGGGPGGHFALTDLTLSEEWLDSQLKSRRRSTIHSYTISTTYHTLPNDAHTRRQVRYMTESKAMKNIFSLSLAFMFVFTGFVSLQSLQSTLHPQSGVGVVSLSVIYGSTVLSCLLAPWLINRITTKWTMVLAFSLYFGYFAANFYPKHYLLIPLSVMLGALAGPMWSAQATYVTTLALTFAQHRRSAETSDETINKFMGIFFGFFRSSQIWGNMISALVLSKNSTGLLDSHGVGNVSVNGSKPEAGSNLSYKQEEVYHLIQDAHLKGGSYTSSSLLRTVTGNGSEALCGVSTCLLNRTTADGIYNNLEVGASWATPGSIPESTRYMLLTTCLACGLMGIVIVVALVDQVKVGKRSADPEFSLTSLELCMSTVRMLKDSKCCLLVPLVIFMGLEQGFMFSDFTKA
ncbi:hypothetical protein ACOMHN_031814 [Nucella lapillus]